MRSYFAKTKQHSLKGSPLFSRGAAFHASGGHAPVVQQRADNNALTKQLKVYQAMADSHNNIQQKKENKTGLRDNLKSGIEHLSGMDISDTKVHYNSSQPAQLNALAYAKGNEIHVAPGQEKHLPHEAWHVVQQKQGRVPPASGLQTTQLYTPVPRKESSTELTLPAFTHEFGRKNMGTQNEGFEMEYIQGNIPTDTLNVSEYGNLAIGPEDKPEYKTFFLTQEKLEQSNTKLKAIKSDFTLAQDGSAIVIKHHPQNYDKKILIQVRADYKGGDQEAMGLESSCDIFHTYITKLHDAFTEIFTTVFENDKQTELSEEDALIIGNKLSKMELEVGDVFEIMSEEAGIERLLWNKHYASIVAMDGPDQVTLENYNREFGDKVAPILISEFGMTARILDDKISALKDQLYTWEFDDNGRIPIQPPPENAVELQQELSELQNKSKKWNSILRNSKEKMPENFTSYHFKMYGPALKKQSFLDKWKDTMQFEQNKFSVAKAQE